MAIPLRANGLPGPQKHLVLFVHGFSSSPECWDSLIKLLRKDRRFEAYEFRCYHYPTSKTDLHLLTRNPTLTELGRGLGAYVSPFLGDENGEAYIDITLVGHSMGGLVIQSWLVDQLRNGRTSELKQIRQIMLLATPNLGSQIATGLRKVLYFFAPNPQEKILRVLNDNISEISSTINQKVISGRPKNVNEFPIPMHAFWGLKDRIVERASACGLFPNCSPLPCDHFEITRPSNKQSDTYVQLSDAILEPEGHQHLFEIQEFKFKVRVEPRAEDFEYLAEHGTKKRMVKTNNVAHISREAKFARKNRCRDVYTIKYATRNEGFIWFKTSHTNIAPSDQTVIWNDSGTFAMFQFYPEAAEAYSLNLRVYKGFDKGLRDVHHHLKEDCFFRKYTFVLDLSMYLKQGYKFSIPPKLCFLKGDRDHDAYCIDGEKLHSEAPSEHEDGVWRWELEYLRDGIADVRWEFLDT